MLQATGNFGLLDETLPCFAVPQPLGTNLLDRHLSVELTIMGNQDLPKPPLLVSRQNAKAIVFRRRLLF